MSVEGRLSCSELISSDPLRGDLFVLGDLVSLD